MADARAPEAETGAQSSGVGSSLRVAFVVDTFPVVSETFVIDQIAQLEDRGVAVEIFAFNRGDTAHVTERFFKYHMDERVQYVCPPAKLPRIAHAIPKALKLAARSPPSSDEL